ncbi:hypothetical protein MRX96_054075, partial [Rhipicephalus microplus]
HGTVCYGGIVRAHAAAHVARVVHRPRRICTLCNGRWGQPGGEHIASPWHRVLATALAVRDLRPAD